MLGDSNAVEREVSDGNFTDKYGLGHRYGWSKHLVEFCVEHDLEIETSLL